MKPSKLGPSETVLDVGCEGGGLTLLRAEVLAWEEAPIAPGKRARTPRANGPKAVRPGEVFWIERNEVMLCDLLDEADQVSSPFSRSDYRTTFQEAISCFMDEYSWWKFYPIEVHSKWRETVIDLLEKRIPGWRGAPSRWFDECSNIERWIEVLQPVEPVLVLTYQLERQDQRPQGIRIEITATPSLEGRCWELPFRSGDQDWSKWKPEVPGIALPDEEAVGILECVQRVRFSLPHPSDEKPNQVRHRLTLAMAGCHLQFTWGDFVPVELADFKILQGKFLDSWTPIPALPVGD